MRVAQVACHRRPVSQHSGHNLILAPLLRLIRRRQQQQQQQLQSSSVQFGDVLLSASKPHTFACWWPQTSGQSQAAKQLALVVVVVVVAASLTAKSGHHHAQCSLVCCCCCCCYRHRRHPKYSGRRAGREIQPSELNHHSVCSASVVAARLDSASRELKWHVEQTTRMAAGRKRAGQLKFNSRLAVRPSAKEREREKRIESVPGASEPPIKWPSPPPLLQHHTHTQSRPFESLFAPHLRLGCLKPTKAQCRLQRTTTTE